MTGRNQRTGAHRHAHTPHSFLFFKDKENTGQRIVKNLTLRRVKNKKEFHP